MAESKDRRLSTNPESAGGSGSGDAKAPLSRRQARSVIVRDLVIFQIKLLLDGLKDVVLSPLAILAAALDFMSPTARSGRRFYAVLMLGERFDRWLSLFSVSEKAATHEEGLFGASRAGSNTMLGKLEELVLGRSEEDPSDQDRGPGRK